MISQVVIKWNFRAAIPPLPGLKSIKPHEGVAMARAHA
jgi:hypothetical protein